jgi:ABC-type lipoprotein export system ATPase subunit/GNAT superfamily N-acetyltransferase
MQDNSLIPKTIDVVLQSPMFSSFRCQCAANSLDIDVAKKSVHHLHIDNVNIPSKWNIGLVVGSSGSGKTTLIKKLFGDNVFDCDIDENLPIIEQFPKSMTYEDCAKILNGIGLTSVPCWIRPYKTLSNGQQARAQAAFLMSKTNDIVCLDEWTSVVDRTVAKAMSVCVDKFTRKNNKKIILCSCHYDIIEWLRPDWIIDCNRQEFQLPTGDDFFFQKRDKLQFDIREIDSHSWKYFSKYHYLNENLPFGICYYYGLFHGENQIGFQCFTNYVPHKKGTKLIMHSNRTVIHPDYVGLGLGMKLIDETSRLLLRKLDCRIMGKFSSVPVYKAMKKNPNWVMIEEKLLFNRMKKRGNMTRNSGFRDKGIKTWSFEYIGGK